MPTKKAKSEKCVYQVVTTEFWRNAYQIEAENHGAALVMFECLKLCRALPEPRRMLLGVIDPPEQVLDAEGKMVYNNTPPGDDAERMLFLEMWRRMYDVQVTAELAIKISIQFICKVKKWDPQAMWEEVKRQR